MSLMQKLTEACVDVELASMSVTSARVQLSTALRALDEALERKRAVLNALEAGGVVR